MEYSNCSCALQVPVSLPDTTWPPRSATQLPPAAATHKGMEPSGGAVQGPMGNRLHQKLMTLMTFSLPSLNETFSNGWGPSVEQLAQYIKPWGVHSPQSLPVATLTVHPHGEVPHTLLPPQRGQVGHICLDILKHKWSILYDVRTILLSIQSPLGEPNTDSPLNTHEAKLWKNPTAFNKHLQETYSKQVPNQDPRLSSLSPRVAFLFFFFRWSVLFLIPV